MNFQFDQKSIEALAIDVRKNFIAKEYFQPIRIFLCGGSIFDKTKMRYKIQNYLFQYQRQYPSSSRYAISYPEDLFDELLMSKKYDLLSLESLLADSVNVIIIAVESPGSIAELGAFANDKRLIKKTIVINDIKFKQDKSFINQGPIKLLKKVTPTSVMYLDFNEPNFSQLTKSIKTVMTNNQDGSNELTLLNLDSFILPFLYITGTLNTNTINQAVRSVIKNKDFSEQITSSSLTSMIKKKLVEKKNDTYSLSKYGVDKFDNYIYFRNRDKLDEIRLKYLNLLYRGKRLVS